MHLMRQLRRQGYFKNSMIDEIEAESRIPNSFKNRNRRPPPEQVVKVEQDLDEEQGLYRNCTFLLVETITKR